MKVLEDFKDRNGLWVASIWYNGESIRTRAGATWYNMTVRCSEAYKLRNPTYSACRHTFVDFQDFANWCHKQIGYGCDGFQLDKDLLLKGNKVYSKETCTFLPKKINAALVKRDSMRGSLPIGVYLCKQTGKYATKVGNGPSRVHLGRYDSPYDAFLAYKSAKEESLRILADEYKNEISEKAYCALVTYSVDKND